MLMLRRSEGSTVAYITNQYVWPPLACLKFDPQNSCMRDAYRSIVCIVLTQLSCALFSGVLHAISPFYSAVLWNRIFIDLHFQCENYASLNRTCALSSFIRIQSHKIQNYRASTLNLRSIRHNCLIKTLRRLFTQVRPISFVHTVHSCS
jgi:hypothetical protein